MYAVKGWKEFQHYSKRNPPWVKLHRRFLDDYEFHTLPVAGFSGYRWDTGNH